MHCFRSSLLSYGHCGSRHSCTQHWELHCHLEVFVVKKLKIKKFKILKFPSDLEFNSLQVFILKKMKNETLAGRENSRNVMYFLFSSFLYFHLASSVSFFLFYMEEGRMSGGKELNFKKLKLCHTFLFNFYERQLNSDDNSCS